MMIRWFISRHNGAIEWAKRKELPVDRWVPHLNIDEIRKGDVVMGTLPFALAADVCSRGAAFYALDFQTEESQRGKNLTADDLTVAEACLQRYTVVKGEEYVP
ncbi:MAG: CRISPR-associated protein Csx16 [Desulfovibrio sp.]|jgi:CRISPR-associated protein Csx16|nr:CRISPR-associated protein Csx16 [Desulfovibrio sp.]